MLNEVRGTDTQKLKILFMLSLFLVLPGLLLQSSPVCFCPIVHIQHKMENMSCKFCQSTPQWKYSNNMTGCQEKNKRREEKYKTLNIYNIRAHLSNANTQKGLNKMTQHCTFIFFITFCWRSALLKCNPLYN